MKQNRTKDSLLAAYLINGDDELKREVILKRLKERVEKMGDISFNYDSFEGEAARGDEIVAACNTMPFASEVRLVQVNNADKLKKADSEPIVDYLGSPSSTTVLALISAGLAKNTRLYKAVAALGKTAVIDCSSQRKSELPKMVRQIAVGYGVVFSDAAAVRLVERVGENTVRLDAEIKKVALACADSGEVSEAQVNDLVQKTVEIKPWEFVDAFAARDLCTCLELLPYMKATSLHALMAMCTTRLRELICAKSLEARGSGHALAETLKVPPWRVKNHTTWARTFSSEELRQAIVAACETERKMKSGVDPESAFFDWVLGVAG